MQSKAKQSKAIQKAKQSKENKKKQKKVGAKQCVSGAPTELLGRGDYDGDDNGDGDDIDDGDGDIDDGDGDDSELGTRSCILM